MELGRAILAIIEANGLTAANVRDTLRDALSDAFPQPQDGSYTPSPWLCDSIGDDASGFIVYSLGGDTYSCPYVITQTGDARSTTLSLSQAVPVMPRTVYDLDGGTTIEGSRKATPKKQSESEISEACEITEATAALLEEAKASGKYKFRIKVIQAGKGSSAFYPKEVLQRDGPTTFPAGTKMYWNHATAAEEASRPEGNLDHLSAVTTSAATWDENGPKGPALYSNAEAYPHYEERIKAMGPNIGVSIRAYGEGKQDKNTGFTLTKFTRGASIDFVTLPGAGGAVLTESAKANQPTNGDGNEMTEAQVQALIETRVAPLAATVETQRTTIESQGATIATQRTALVLERATSMIGEAIRATRLPEPSKARVTAALVSATLPVDAAGALDVAKLGEAIAAAVKAEGEYLTLVGGPVVTGMGPGAIVTEADEVKSKANVLEMARRSAGAVAVNDESAKRLAEVYAEGR